MQYKNSKKMNKIVYKEHFSEKVAKIVLEAPEIAISRKPGHFVIVRVDQKGERIPLTIADFRYYSRYYNLDSSRSRSNFSKTYSP